jgi:hypothetical protein
MLAICKWLFTAIWEARQEVSTMERAVKSKRLDQLEAELVKRGTEVTSVAESACLLNMLYHVKLERIMKGL